MKRFVVYEVWTRSYVVNADTEGEALDEMPSVGAGGPLSLCNWHAVEVPTEKPTLQVVKG